MVSMAITLIYARLNRARRMHLIHARKDTCHSDRAWPTSFTKYACYHRRSRLQRILHNAVTVAVRIAMTQGAILTANLSRVPVKDSFHTSHFIHGLLQLLQPGQRRTHGISPVTVIAVGRRGISQTKSWGRQGKEESMSSFMFASNGD